MLWRNRVITQVVVLCAVAGGAPAATAPPRTTAVGFGIVAHGVRSNGDQASGGSIGRTWAHDGDTQRLWLYADRTSSCAMTLSSVGPPSGDAAIVWTVDATLVSHDADMATVDLDMTREVRDQAITLDAVHQRRRRLALLEGNDPLVLEYARPEATQGDCDGYVIEAGMHVQDPPDVADARLAYDLWLVQTDRAGRQRVQRVEAQAGQGRPTEFGFAPLWFAQDGTPDASGPRWHPSQRHGPRAARRRRNRASDDRRRALGARQIRIRQRRSRREVHRHRHRRNGRGPVASGLWRVEWSGGGDSRHAAARVVTVGRTEVRPTVRRQAHGPMNPWTHEPMNP